MSTSLEVRFDASLPEHGRRVLKELVESTIRRIDGAQLKLSAPAKRRFVVELRNGDCPAAFAAAIRLQRASAFLAAACLDTATVGALAIAIQGSERLNRTVSPRSIVVCPALTQRFARQLDEIIALHPGDFVREHDSSDGSCVLALTTQSQWIGFPASAGPIRRAALMLPLNGADSLKDSWEESKSQIDGIAAVLRANPTLTQERWLVFHDHSMDVCQALGIVLDEMRLGTRWFFSTMSTVSWRLAKILIRSWNPAVGDPPRLVCTISGVSDDESYAQDSVFRLYIRSDDEAAKLVGEAGTQQPTAVRAIICHSRNHYGELTATAFERCLKKWKEVRPRRCEAERLRDRLAEETGPALVFVAMYGETLIDTIVELVQLSEERRRKDLGEITVYLTHTVTAEPVLTQLAEPGKLKRLARIPFNWRVCVPEETTGQDYRGDVLELFSRLTFLRFMSCIRAEENGDDPRTAWHHANPNEGIHLVADPNTNDSKVGLACVSLRSVMERHRNLSVTGPTDPGVLIAREANTRQREIELSLLQCDLAGHSGWFKDLEPEQKWAATEAKRDLERMIFEQLAPRFVRVDWAGDGGLYAASGREVTARSLVSSADVVRRIFESWREVHGHELQANRLKFRLSCHQGRVWIHDEVEFWASEDLNWFVKNERRIGDTRAVGITQAVYEDLETVGRGQWVRTGSDPGRGNFYSKLPALLEIFVAAPMTSIPLGQYNATRAGVTKIIDSIGAGLPASAVHSAIRDRTAPAEFLEPRLSLQAAFDNISKSGALLLLWNDAVPTSALVELGIALGLGKTCVVVTNNRSTLPYMIRDSLDGTSGGASSLQMHVVETSELWHADETTNALIRILQPSRL